MVIGPSRKQTFINSRQSLEQGSSVKLDLASGVVGFGPVFGLSRKWCCLGLAPPPPTFTLAERARARLFLGLRGQ